jgi:hypothetical protein
MVCRPLEAASDILNRKSRDLFGAIEKIKTEFAQEDVRQAEPDSDRSTQTRAQEAGSPQTATKDVAMVSSVFECK